MWMPATCADPQPRNIAYLVDDLTDRKADFRAV